jgi:CubicO group peptidase (beta-lactamase class C family)
LRISVTSAANCFITVRQYGLIHRDRREEAFDLMNSPRILHVLVLLLVLLCAGSAMAQNTPLTDLDTYVARAMKTFDVPGLSVAIVKDGKVILAKGYGVRKLGESVPVDESTLFGIGSNTKAFTSAALATLVDAGKISWDDPVYQRLPDFQMYDPYVSHEMTIRDLLTHRSGMGLGEGDLLFWPQTTYTRADIIYRLRFMKPASSFRSHYAYDNLLYMTAGQIIPAVTGTSWDDYVRKHIFEQLGMTNSNVSTAAYKPGGDYASPHSKLDGKLQVLPFENLDNVGPAGSINSSAADMALWVTVQLAHGKIPNKDAHLFSEAQSREMWSPQTILPIGEPTGPLAALRANFAAYGLGWGLRDYHGRKLVAHTGGVAGFVSRVMLVPQENLGVVILTNAEQGGAFDSILFHILDHYLALQPADWIAAFKTKEEADQKEADEIIKKQNAGRAADSNPSLPLEKYAGVYTDPWYGPITIRMENGKLTFTMDHTPSAVADLQHWQYDTFKAHWRERTIEDAFVTFALNPDGSINHFTMVAVSPLADFSFDYQDLYFTPQKAAASIKP